MWRREGIYYQLINSIQSDHHSINSPRSTGISAFSSQPICFLITHPHSSMHPSCLLHPPLHFLNSISFQISSSSPSSSTFSPFYLSVDLFIPVFMLFTSPAPLTDLHPLLLFLSIYRHHLLCNRLSFRFHQHLFSLVHHTHQVYASSFLLHLLSNIAL